MADKGKRMNAGKLRSMEKLSHSMFDILQDKPFNKVTVTELCERAGLVRKTFYRNFGSLEEVVVYRLDKLFSDLTEKFDFEHSGGRPVLTYCFTQLVTDRAITVVFLDGSLYPVVLGKVKDYVEASFNKTLHSALSFEPTFAEYYTTFIADGILSVVRSWVRDGCKHTAQTMASLVDRLLSGVIA